MILHCLHFLLSSCFILFTAGEAVAQWSNDDYRVSQEILKPDAECLEQLECNVYGANWGQDEYHGWRWTHPDRIQNDGLRENVAGSVYLPYSAPEHASPPLDPAFIGFAFEQASFPRYVQTRDGEVNQYSLNLIDAILSRTGGKPIVRLGGTSADFAHYIPDQKEPALPLAEVDNYQDVGGTTIGPSYWDLTHIIPNSTYIVQLPLANTNISESIVWAKTAVERIGLDRIQAFEPGNEPEIYPNRPKFLGPPEYQGKFTNETYTGNFTKYVNAIKAELDLSGEPWFQAFDIAAHLGKNVLATSYILDVETNFKLGLNKYNDIKTVAAHWYQTSGGSFSRLASGLMQHSAIAFRLDLFRKFITFLRDNHPHIPFIVSEVGNSLHPKHVYEYQAVLGSALWAVDFQLYAMSIGVARINWQQIMHAGYDMWLPIASADMQKQTFANFYAMPFVADFIGKGGKTRMVQLETGFENVVAYAAFVNEKTVRVAIVNLDFWDVGERERPSVILRLDVPGDCNEVRLDLLSSPLGAHASAESITYAGSQWPANNEGLEVKGVRNDSQVLDCFQGKVYVEVASSSAVLLHLL